MDLAIIRRVLVSQLEDWVELMPDPDKPIIGFAGSERMLSPRDLVGEVEAGTPLGEDMLNHWAALSLAAAARDTMSASVHDEEGEEGYYVKAR